MTTHFKGPVLGSREAAGGLFADKPINSISRGNFIEHFYDFTERSSQEALWTESNIGAGPGTAADVVDDATRGILRCTTTVINTGSSLQPAVVADTSGVHAPTGAGQDIMFEASVSIDDWSNCDWLIGVGLRDTTVLDAGGVILAVFGNNFAGFWHNVALSHGGRPVCAAAGTAVANLQTATSTIPSGSLTDATYYRFGIAISGLDRVRFFLNRAPVTPWVDMTVDFANDALLVPTIAMIANGAPIVMDIDYVHLISERTY